MFSHFSKYTVPQPHKSALITIDLQNDFVLPGAPAEGVGAASAASVTGKVAQFYRERQLPIIHVIRIYSPENNAESVDICRREAVQDGLKLVLSGTEGMQLVSQIIPEGTVADAELLCAGQVQRISATESILYKPRWGCFYKTCLDDLLTQLGVTTVAIAGTWFANCVRTTIYEAAAHDYRVVALRDAIAGIHSDAENDLSKIECGVCDANAWLELIR